MTTHQRLDIHATDKTAYAAILGMEKYVRESGLDAKLYELIKIRASQLNGCAYCLDMHTKDARKLGVDGRKIDVLAGWHEAPSLYSEAEQAALALTESVTLISKEGVPDQVWDAVAAQFDAESQVHLMMAISAINVWNRLAVATHQNLPETNEH